jgi:hypothetical protein
MNIKITVAAGDILDSGNWDAFCKLRGISEWALNEGQMASSEIFSLTLKEAYQIGLRSAIIRGLEQAEDDISNDSSICSGCREDDANNMHSCPYQEAIKANSDTNYCNCCDSCTTQCQNGI